MNSKEQLIKDIQNLLNSYENTPTTSINPDLLTFMDENTLKQIIGDLLDQKDNINEDDMQWLEQFKSYKN